MHSRRLRAAMVAHGGLSSKQLRGPKAFRTCSALHHGHVIRSHVCTRSRSHFFLRLRCTVPRVCLFPPIQIANHAWRADVRLAFAAIAVTRLAPGLRVCRNAAASALSCASFATVHKKKCTVVLSSVDTNCDPRRWSPIRFRSTQEVGHRCPIHKGISRIGQIPRD